LAGSIAENTNELSVIENKHLLKSGFAHLVSNPNETPSVAKINENSPICAKLAPTVRAVLIG
jgi:hypothetical protein